MLILESNQQTQYVEKRNEDNARQTFVLSTRNVRVFCGHMLLTKRLAM